MVMKLWGWFLCHIMGDHDWTCAAAEWIEPTPLQIKNGVVGYADYAKMYCKRCGKVSTLQL